MSSQRTEGSDVTEVEDSDKSWTPSHMSENLSQSQKKGKKKKDCHKNYFVNLCSLLTSNGNHIEAKRSDNSIIGVFLVSKGNELTYS